VDDALKLAYRSRNDLRATLDSEKAAAQSLSAAKGERFPVIAANADYGDIGTTFGHSHGDFTFQAGVNIPIFTGGRIKGDITQAEQALSSANDQYITSLYNHSLAKLSLARALGVARTSYEQYLGGK